MEAALIAIIILTTLSPIVGSLLGTIRKPSKNMLYQTLAFASGVMIAIPFLQLIPESIKLSSPLFCIIGIIAGTLAILFVEKILPKIRPEIQLPETESSKMKRTSIFLLISIFIHNFFEGMAIGIAGIADYGVSIVIGIAIAIHKIPEGLCTSIPYYYSTKDKFKALAFSALTAIPIPIGFFAAFFLFKIIPLQISGAMIGFTAGIMLHIAAHELVPSAKYRTANTSTIFSFTAGIILVVILSAIKI